MLPGIYAEAASAVDPMTRIVAAALWAPDGVLTSAAAAHLGFWQGLAVPVVSLAIPHGRPAVPGWRIEHRRVDPELRVEQHGLVRTCDELTVIDLVRDTADGVAIDTALRHRAITVASLRSVFERLPHRRGNAICARLIEDSRDEPWSPPERDLHRLLRRAGITGWTANRTTVIGSARYAADVRFVRLRLALEVDGFEIHSRREVFELDRARQNAFVLDGWLVLRFTPRQISDRPDAVVDQIRQAIALAEIQKSARHRGRGPRLSGESGRARR